MFHLMKAGKANWHADWARWEVKSLTSTGNLAPSPSSGGGSSVYECKTVCLVRCGADRWWWADEAAVSVLALMLAVSVML